MTIREELAKLEPSGVVRLVELNAQALGAGTLRFHGYKNTPAIYWQGQQYDPWPLAYEGFARTSEQQPRPKIAVGNVGGAITTLCAFFDDLVGARITRKSTLVRFLDAENFLGVDTLAQPLDFASGEWTLPGATLVTANSFQVETAGGVVHGAAMIAGTSYRVKASGLLSKDATVQLRNGTTASAPLIATVAATNGRFDLSAVWPASSGALYLRVATAGTVVTDVALSVQEFIGNPSADPTQEMTPEVWYVERKTMETPEAVEFELASPLELQNVKWPRRQIIPNVCPWLVIGGYRGPYCGYTGPPVAKIDDTPTNDPVLDQCGGRLRSCKLRFGANSELPYGGFPAARLIR